MNYWYKQQQKRISKYVEWKKPDKRIYFLILFIYISSNANESVDIESRSVVFWDEVGGQMGGITMG